MTIERQDASFRRATNAPRGGGMTASLPCGCIPGEYQCPEAQAIWTKVNAAYLGAYSKSVKHPHWATLWSEYDALRATYTEHVCPEGSQEGK